MTSKEKTQKKAKLVTSPVASGGGETFFEQHVNACFLSLLLVRGLPPVLTDCTLEEVSFQAENKGWHTDDVLLVGKRANGESRHFAGQVKRAFTVSSSDSDCVKAFTDFWRDFNNSSVFTEGRDQLGLILLAGNDAAVSRLRPLGDCARASRGAEDFFRRLSVKGLLRASVQQSAVAIETILKEAQEITFTKDGLWRFLKSLHVLSFDLNTSSSTTASLIKSLLSQTATGTDKTGEAELTWGQMLESVGIGMPAAATYTRSSFPVETQQRHLPIPGSMTDALLKATEHSETTLKTIHTAFDGKVSLERPDAVANLLEILAVSRLVLLTGAAGSGKSALAKLAIQSLKGSSFVLAFRAEEFAAPHLDQALLHAQIPANSETLSSLLTAQGRKVLLIESVERLLEKSSREAFLDVLQLCAGDPNWQVLLTCRDYSVDIVRASFLDHLGSTVEIFRTPPLSDDELSEVVNAIPKLTRPSSHPFLNWLFRTPYILDKAARMDWPADGTLPNDESTFRRKFWTDLVRRDSQAAGAFPKRRHDTFVEVCLRRAKALEPFAPCDDLDREALDQLRNDSLIDFAPTTDSLAAPSHDLLEDWAVIEWISSRFAVLRQRHQDFATQLGTFPAIRRAYRKWLDEVLAADAAIADTYVLGVANGSTLPPHFRDDTLVGVLRSTLGGEFLSRNRSVLAAEGGLVLRRVIHLVRVACKTTPKLIRASALPLWFVPSGPAWPAVLKLVHEELSIFLPKEVALIAGLLSDWASGIAWWNPEPGGVSDAANIAFALLPHVAHYSSEDQLKEILKVILKTPTGNPAEFGKLAADAMRNDRSAYAAAKFKDLILSGLDSSFACRGAPDTVIAIAEHTFKAPRDQPRDWRDHSTEIEASFGIRAHQGGDYFPPSALQGPFLSLLRYHPVKGAAFIIRLINHASDTYVDPKLNPRLEQAWAVEAKLPNGLTKKYWCNARLWNLYRGTSDGPYVIISALMALEAFLLELLGRDDVDIEKWLVHILHETNNVAVLAVVASIATANPPRAGKAAITLLTSRYFFRLDLGRLVAESPASLMFPSSGARQELFDGERRESAKLAHRKSHLEFLALNLQFGPLRDEVWATLDGYHGALLSIEQQSEEDKVWRIALNRMDIRRFRAQPTIQPAVASNADTTSPQHGDGKIYFVPGPLDNDLQEMLDKDAPAGDRAAAVTSLFLWGHNAFEREPGSGEGWRERLGTARAMSIPLESEEFPDKWTIDAPVFTAAVCTRDHWPEMASDEQAWCVAKLLTAVNRSAEAADLQIQVSGRSSLEGAGVAAMALPAAIKHGVDAQLQADILATLVVAITHPAENVAHRAAIGISRHLSLNHRAIVYQFVGLLALQAIKLAVLDNTQKEVPYDERLPTETLRALVRHEIREETVWINPSSSPELVAINLDEWHGSTAFELIMVLLANVPEDSLSVQAYSLIARKLASDWIDTGRNNGYRNYHQEHDNATRLARFCLKLPSDDAKKLLEPVLTRVNSSPKEFGSFIKDLIYAADDAGTTEQFWPLWQEIAARILVASWVSRLGETYSRDQGVLRAMFFGINWKKGLTHWRGLDGKAQAIGTFFEGLPPVSAVFAAYTSFLYDIGECSLPDAFLAIERRLRAGDAMKILAHTNTLFCLEGILRRYVYGKPDTLKRTDALRSAVLYMLDQMVDAGSSVAYRMRDDFVTPGGPSPQKDT